MLRNWTFIDIAIVLVCAITLHFISKYLFPVGQGAERVNSASEVRAADTPEQAAIRQRLGCRDRSKSVSIAFSEDWIRAATGATEIRSAIAQTIQLLNSITAVYCFIKVTDDAHKEEVAPIIHNLMPFFNSNRILYHTTEVGKIAFVRQIRPHLHVDYDINTLKNLRPHIPKGVLVADKSIGNDGDRSSTGTLDARINTLAELAVVSLSQTGKAVM